MPLFELPERSIDCGESFREWAQPSHHYVPTYQEWRLYQAVRSAKAMSLFYVADIYAHAKEQLADMLTRDIIEKNFKNAPTENGVLGYIIYKMSNVVDAIDRLQSARACLSSLMDAQLVYLHQQLKGPYRFLCGNYKTASSLTIAGIDTTYGRVTLHLKVRGSKHTYQQTIDANRTEFHQLLGNGGVTKRSVEGVEFLWPKGVEMGLFEHKGAA